MFITICILCLAMTCSEISIYISEIIGFVLVLTCILENNLDVHVEKYTQVPYTLVKLVALEFIFCKSAVAFYCIKGNQHLVKALR